MKRTLLTVILVLSILGCVFAQSLDYRQVIFGNNYEQIHEIDADTFFSKYPQVKNIELFSNGQPAEIGKNDFALFTSRRVYEQKLGKEKIYRVLLSEYAIGDIQLLDWRNKNTYFDQYVFYEIDSENVLFLGTYTFNRVTGTQFGNFPSYENIEIIQRNNKIIGFMVYNLAFYERWSADVITESKAEYIPLDKLLEKAIQLQEGLSAATLKVTETAKDDSIYKYEIGDTIKIEASRPLIDSRRPFMYTIQNAFDGNPATSYVEDTENDLFSIILEGDIFIRKLAVINGYAQNKDLYHENSRIQEITSEFFINNEKGMSEKISEKNRKYHLADNMLDFQVINYPTNGYFFVTGVYKGTKYTDVCLAELDVFTDEHGWLFGGSDE